MRVVRFYAPEDVRVEDAPEPTAGPGDLVIRVRNCSICGTDAKIWRSGHPNLSPPRVLGHELAGEVVEGGGGWSVGDRVQVIAAIPTAPATSAGTAGRRSAPTRSGSATSTTAASPSSCAYPPRSWPSTASTASPRGCRSPRRPWPSR